MERDTYLGDIPDWRTLHDEATIVDLHAHPSLKASLFYRALAQRIYPSPRAFDPFAVRTNFPRLREGGVDVLLSVIYAPEIGITNSAPPLKLLRYITPRLWHNIYGRGYFTVANEMMDMIERQAQSARDEKNGFQLARFAHSVDELDDILKQPDSKRPVALIHSIEGGHALEGKLSNLDTFFQRGVAYITLAHFYPNEIVSPTFPWPEHLQRFGWFQDERDLTRGLTPFGEKVIERMTELGMLIDIAHCTPPARKRIYDIVGNRAPLIATHVGAYDINPDPYNLKDWEMKKIADGGGVIGVIFMNYWLIPSESERGLNVISDTLRTFYNLAGEDHVGLGTDFDGFTEPPSDLVNAAQLPRLTQRLLVEGFSAAQVKKILGGNAMRVLRQGWGKKGKPNDSTQ
ncbi:MAG: membrane dipeptidase [Anaerolineales bacterium]|jgi:membrane dipeptidase